MLQKFSWSEYWTVVIAVVAVYYAIVFLLLRKNGLLPKLSFKKKERPKSEGVQAAALPEAIPKKKSIANLENQSEIENQLKRLNDEVFHFLQDIAGKSYIKEEVIMGFRVFLRDYQEFSQTEYRSDIDEFIKIETENYLSVDLSDDDLKRVWMG